MHEHLAWSWAEFFLEQRRALTAYALALVGNPLDAEDLIQDVLVQMVQQHHPVANARAYVLRCLRNRAIDRRRAAGARPEQASLTADTVAPLDPHAAGPELAETVARLQTALAQLGPRQREVIVLKTYCELTFREIAELLDEPLGTVTSHYRRGLRELRLLCTHGGVHVT